MARPKKTEVQLNDMRQKILDAAYALLLEKGPEGLTSRAIAEQLGMSHMALFTYFPNKAAIFRALTDREYAKMRPQQEAFEQRAALEDVDQVIREALNYFAAFARDNPNPYRVAWVLPEMGVESKEQNRQRMQATVGFLARLIVIGMAQGRYAAREPVLTAATVLGMVNMPYILFHTGKIIDPGIRDRMAVEVIDAAMGYLNLGSRAKK